MIGLWVALLLAGIGLVVLGATVIELRARVEQLEARLADVPGRYQVDPTRTLTLTLDNREAKFTPRRGSRAFMTNPDDPSDGPR